MTIINYNRLIPTGNEFTPYVKKKGTNIKPVETITDNQQLFHQLLGIITRDGGVN
jgi:hypothetical protein